MQRCQQHVHAIWFRPAVGAAHGQAGTPARARPLPGCCGCRCLFFLNFITHLEVLLELAQVFAAHLARAGLGPRRRRARTLCGRRFHLRGSAARALGPLHLQGLRVELILFRVPLGAVTSPVPEPWGSGCRRSGVCVKTAAGKQQNSSCGLFCNWRQVQCGVEDGIAAWPRRLPRAHTLALRLADTLHVRKKEAHSPALPSPGRLILTGTEAIGGARRA